MNEHSEKYWDDLGVAWRAIDVNIDVVTPRLRSRLRRQSFLIRAAFVIGVPLATCAIVLGALTIWWGWATAAWNFVIRGTAIGIVATLLLKALLSFASIRTDADARALAEMLDLAIKRARTTVAVIRVGLFMCASATVLGIVGAVIRTRAGNPPALSPVVDVAVLMLVTVIVLVYRQRARVTLAKLRHLKQAIESNPSGDLGRR
jgi:hypothetical protein